MGLIDDMKDEGSKYDELQTELGKLNGLLQPAALAYQTLIFNAHSTLVNNMRTDFRAFFSEKGFNVDVNNCRASLSSLDVSYQVPANKPEGLSSFMIHFKSPSGTRTFTINLVPNIRVKLVSIHKPVTRQTGRRPQPIIPPTLEEMEKEVEAKKNMLDGINRAQATAIEFTFVGDQMIGEVRTFKELLEKIDATKA